MQDVRCPAYPHPLTCISVRGKEMFMAFANSVKFQSVDKVKKK